MKSLQEGICYNVKKFHYATGTQVRIYQKPLTHGSIREEREYENDEKDIENDVEDEESKHNKSVESSKNRTIQSIYGIARANMWDYFLTVTFDPKKVDSTDYELVSKKVIQWLNNLKKRVSPCMRYLLVPELHSDGRKWHFHGLLANCPELSLKDSGLVKDGKVIYNLSNWKYGFSTVTEVADSGRVSSYITKYITKELCDFSKGKKRYWASKNCLRANDVMEIDMVVPDDIEKYIRSISSEVKYMKQVKNEKSGQIVTYIEV